VRNLRRIVKPAKRGQEVDREKLVQHLHLVGYLDHQVVQLPVLAPELRGQANDVLKEVSPIEVSGHKRVVAKHLKAIATKNGSPTFWPIRKRRSSTVR